MYVVSAIRPENIQGGLFDLKQTEKARSARRGTHREEIDGHQLSGQVADPAARGGLSALRHRP